jgi:hypothetical protein
MNIEHPTLEAVIKEENPQELTQLLESGRFDRLTEEITLRALLAAEIKQTRIRYEAAHQLDFLEEMDWEALTMLKLYDKRTFEHSINTYAILKTKINAIKHDDRTLAEIIVQEGYSLEELLRAALLHDVGKIKIPIAVINNPITRGEWREIFEEQEIIDQKAQLIKLLGKKEWEDPDALSKIAALRDEDEVNALPDDEYDEDKKNRILEEARHDILAYIDKQLIPATQLVPIRKGMSKENIQALKDRGFDPDEALGSIMRRHEKFTGDVISHVAAEQDKNSDHRYSEEALYKIIELATHHHNYDRDEKFLAEHPATATSLNISTRLASLISMADLKEAMESHARAYRKGEADMMEIFREFIIHAERGFIDKHYTALWLESDLKELEQEKLEELSDDQMKELKSMLDWITEYAK